MVSRILVTGASGFVGGAFLTRASLDGRFILRAALRKGAKTVARRGVEPVYVDDLAAPFGWRVAVSGCNGIVHAAARVHVMRDSAPSSIAEFRRINVVGTLNIARYAAEAGVRRFVYVSSVKVNGEQTFIGQPFTADDVPAPVDPYGISKHEAELGLMRLARETGMEVVVIRPVLVYGPGVKANFLSMMRWLYRGIPLPFGSLHNRRSLVAVDNLVDLILTCLHHPKAPDQTFLVSDGEDLSTTALLRRTAAALGRPARLVPVPALLLRTSARVLGKADLAQRLCGSLQVDISKTRELLGWVPPVSVDEALKQTAQHFLANL